MNTPPNLSSVGRLAELLQVSVHRVEQTIDELALKPVLTLNGLAYYSASVEDVLLAVLHRRDLTADELAAHFQSTPPAREDLLG